jgi:hypothetical protein
MDISMQWYGTVVLSVVAVPTNRHTIDHGCGFGANHYLCV